MAVVLAGAYLGGGAYAIRRKRWRSDLLWPFGIAVVSILFALTATGNHVRIAAETAKWMPQFSDFSVVKKASLGFFTTFSFYFGAAHYNVVLLGLAVAVLAGVVAHRRRPGEVFLVALPALWIAVVGFATRVATNSGKGSLLLAVIYHTRHARRVSHDSITYLLVGGLFLVLLGALLWGLYRVFGRGPKLVIAYGTLGLGFLSRVLIGFSPTLYASGGRTTILCSMAITMVTVMVVADLLDSLKRPGSRSCATLRSESL